jgi:multidrug efflux pump subunit AcrB
METLVKFFIENHKLTIIISIFLIIFGLMGAAKLNSESYPSVNFAMATINTRYEGATASDIELKITKPIEEEIRTVSGLKDVKSVSKSGMSSIFVRIDMDNEDEDKVMTDLQKAVDRVSNLPSDLRDKPVFKEINSEEFPAIEIAITGDNKNRARDLMADLLKEELEDNKKVLSVRPVGFLKRQFNIYLNQQKLQDYHIGINEVVGKVQRRNVNIPGGEVKTFDKKDLIRVEGKIRNEDELKNLVVRSNFNGKEIKLSDVAEVLDGEEEAKYLASYNGEPATLLVVTKKAGADTLKLVEEVSSTINRYTEKYKDQFKIHIYNNEAEKVKNRLAILNSNALQGLVLVVVFLLIFLPGKIGIMSSLSLPICVMATVGLMPMMGMNLNAITILALVIALGMLVDNSVVIAEYFTVLRTQGMSPTEAATKSVTLLWLPISATVFTTVAAFMPMLVTKGVMGQFIKWIPIVVSMSLLISLAESFFLLPMRLKLVGEKVKNLEETGKDWFGKVATKFENLLEWCIRRRYLVGGLFGLILVGCFLLMSVGNKFILFPAEQTEVYLARIEMVQGTPAEKTINVVNEITLKIKETLGEDAKHLVSRAGTSQTDPTDPKGSDGESKGLIIIYASDFAKYNIKDTEYLKKLRDISHPEVPQLIFEALVNGPPVGSPINATFRSNNEQELSGMVEEIKKELSQIKGVRDLTVDEVIGPDEVLTKINYERADQLGLTVAEAGDTIRTAFSGTIASQVNLDNKDIDINIRLEPLFREKVENLETLKVMDRQGNLIPLQAFSSFEKREGSHEIKRFDFKRAKTLSGNIDDTFITAPIANKKLTEIYNNLLTKYPGVSIVFGGEEESTKESMQSLAEALVLAMIGIFAIMVFLFKSYLRPFIIMTTIPLGLVGFSIAFFFHQKPISFLAMIGIIGLAGIIVNSGIVLISFIDDMRKEGKLSLHEILVKSSGLRLRAVLVTSLTTVSGLFPTAYGIGGADEMLIPMTMALAWGLTSGTILTLIWIPCAYAILEDWNILMTKVPLIKNFYHHDAINLEEIKS